MRYSKKPGTATITTLTIPEGMVTISVRAAPCERAVQRSCIGVLLTDGRFRTCSLGFIMMCVLIHKNKMCTSTTSIHKLFRQLLSYKSFPQPHYRNCPSSFPQPALTSLFATTCPGFGTTSCTENQHPLQQSQFPRTSIGRLQDHYSTTKVGGVSVPTKNIQMKNIKQRNKTRRCS